MAIEDVSLLRFTCTWDKPILTRLALLEACCVGSAILSMFVVRDRFNTPFVAVFPACQVATSMDGELPLAPILSLSAPPTGTYRSR